MTIASIAHYKIFPVSVPLRTAFAISSAHNDHALNAVIILQDTEGREAVGEIAPYPALTGDDLVSACAAAEAVLSALKGMTVAKALRFFYDVAQPQYKSCPSALAGVELALLDMSSQQTGVRLGQLWGTAFNPKVQTDITLPIMPLDNVQQFWQRYQGMQVSYLKIKIGNEPISTSLDRICELMKHAGPYQFSLDGNQGCTVDSALAILAKLESLKLIPLFFEQPLNELDWQGTARLARSTSVPLCADELVKTPEDAARVAREGCGKIINLKFVKSGIANAIDIAKVAIAAKLDLMIGGMLESEIMMTASLHAAATIPAIRYIDLDTPFFFSKRLTTASPYHQSSAHLLCPSGPGLGLIANKPVLQELRVSLN